MPIDDFKFQIESIARDLMNLEVNTIIKPNMTGRKMPKPRHAIVDIAQNYQRKLMAMGLWPEDCPAHLGSEESFSFIRETASMAINAYGKKRKAGPLSDTDEADLVMLFRIKKMSDQIKGIFNDLKRRGVENWNNDLSRAQIEQQQPALLLTTDEVVLLRKIWEMGMEQIAIQTLIQLDGDILTRIQPRYTDESPTSRTIQSIHSQNVTISLSFWGQLVGIVQDFFAGLSKFFTR